MQKNQQLEQEKVCIVQETAKVILFQTFFR